MAKLSIAIRTLLSVAAPVARIAPAHPTVRAQAIFKESIKWRDPLCAAIRLTEKELVEAIAIGWLRNAAESVIRIRGICMAQIGQ